MVDRMLLVSYFMAVISSLLHECLINIIYTLLLQAIGLTGCVVLCVAAGAMSAASLAWLVSAISRLHNVVGCQPNSPIALRCWYSGLQWAAGPWENSCVMSAYATG